MSDFFFSSSGAGTIKVGGGGGDHRQEKGELEEDEEEAFGDRGATAGAIAGAVGAPRRRGDAARADARPGVHLRRVGDLRRGDGERAGDVAGRGVVIRFVS